MVMAVEWEWECEEEKGREECVREEEGSRHFLGLLESNGSRALVALSLFLQISQQRLSPHAMWRGVARAPPKFISLALVVALSLV